MKKVLKLRAIFAITTGFKIYLGTTGSLMAVTKLLITQLRCPLIAGALFYLILTQVSIVILPATQLIMSGKYPSLIFQAMKSALFQRSLGKGGELLIPVRLKATYLTGDNNMNKTPKTAKIMIRKKMAGLTIIELIVAIGIFSLVIAMTVSIFVLAITTQRRITALKNVEDNIRFTLESMAREIKTGKDFSTGVNSLSFTNDNGESVVYRLNANIIEKSSDGGINYSAVTGSEVTINYLNFYLIGESTGDGLEPRVTITMSATSQAGNQSANLKVQTTISERLLQS